MLFKLMEYSTVVHCYVIDILPDVLKIVSRVITFYVSVEV